MYLLPGIFCKGKYQLETRMVEESVEFYLRYTAVPAVLPIKTYVRTFSRKSRQKSAIGYCIATAPNRPAALRRALVDEKQSLESVLITHHCLHPEGIVASSGLSSFVSLVLSRKGHC